MSVTGYKATRPDGTSFYDAHTRWEVGRTVKAPVPHRNLLCGPGILHFSDAPAETLVGGSWPCRLFSVSGRPVAQNGHKFGAWSLKVLAELPAWQVFGPQGEEVVALLQDIPLVTASGTAKDVAWDAAREAARAVAWDAAREAARAVARYAAWDAARAAARGAARHAAAALVTRDLISPEQFAVLWEPWAKFAHR